MAYSRCISRRPRVLSLIAPVFFLVSAVLFADTIELKDATVIEGKIIGKSSKAIVVLTASGKMIDVSPEDIEKITRGTESKKSSQQTKESSETHSESVSGSSNAAQGLNHNNPEAKKRFEEEIKAILKNMRKEPLEVWPDKEKNQPVDKNDPPNSDWKVMTKDGAIKFLKEVPDHTAGHVKVWGKCRPAVYIMEHHIGGGIVNRSGSPSWGRMYWSKKLQSWCLAHPNQLAFKRNQDAALYLAERIERAINPDAASAIRSHWFKLINARSGASKDEVAVKASIKQTRRTMEQLTMKMGKGTGVGSDLWRVHTISMDIEPRINPLATTQARVSMAKQRQKLLQQIVEKLCRKESNNAAKD
ncbi:hypothetical protein ACFLS1_02295 [Verrucomicrobiota bacterium]